MDFTPNNYPILIPLAPLAAAIFSAVPLESGKDRKYAFGVLAQFIAFAAALVAFVDVGFGSATTRSVVVCETPWSFLPSIELSIDRLSAVMMLVITSIGLVLYRYSIRYLQSDRGQSRYLALLALTIATLLVMVSSRDLVLLFLAWQLLSWLLCLLAHNHAHLPTARSSFRTFIMLRFGDVAFLAGIVLAYRLYGTVEFAALFERAATTSVTLELFGGAASMSGATAVTALIFIGAMSKSAQVPLHMWLPDSLYAPTPIHGLLHAGIINAGGFLLTRLAPLYVLSPATLHIVFFIGLATAVLGTSMMLVQNDIKKTLGYSTIGQMGYMIMECGLGAFSLAIFHLIAHGFFKASIFLNCGNVIHETRQEPKWPSKTSDGPGIGALNWVIGFSLSLALPLVIVYFVHEFLHVPLRDSQGLIIFLFFSWVTASQAMLTLYRLQKGHSLKLQSILLILVTLVTLTYLYSAELFTSFLYPSPETVASYFQAAALPHALFWVIVAIAATVITIGWVIGYAKRQGHAAQRSHSIASMRTSLYLFFVNRLYLDGVARRLRFVVKSVGESLDRSRYFFPVSAVVAMALAASRWTLPVEASLEVGLTLLATGLLIPLFPFHSAYVAALTRLPRLAALVAAVALPLAGLFGLTQLAPSIPAGVQQAVSTLALFGAIYASIKAVVQKCVPHLISYAGLALYSILWWKISSGGKVTGEVIVYACSVTVVLGGILLAWDRLRVRYGNLAMSQLGGLARPMPRFSLCLALLVMAAVGLPPFGLAFSFLGIMLGSPGVDAGTFVVLLTWLGASWYLFKLMQRLLFGPHRNDIRYVDLRPIEIAAFAAVLVLLIALTIVPQEMFDTIQHVAAAIEMEMK